MDTIYNGFSKSGGTYKITNKLNNKVYYGSGKCFTKRQYQHLKLLENNKHGNKHLQNAFNQYGSDAFVFEVVEVIEGTKQNRLDAEQKLLDLYWDNCVRCYNIDKKSQSREGCKSKNPEDTRKKLSISAKTNLKITATQFKKGSIPANKGKICLPLSDEHKKKISESNKGKTISKETKEKISNRNKDKFFGNKELLSKITTNLWANKEYRKKQSETRNTEEYKLKISGINNTNYGKESPTKGVSRTDETKLKISLAQKGKPKSEEYKRKKRKIYENFYLVSPNGVIYTKIENIVQFCTENGLNRGHLISVLNGKRKTHKNWKILKD